MPIFDIFLLEAVVNGLLLGGVDFSDIAIPLKSAAAGKEAVTMNIGTFLNNVISFLIVAAAVFMLVKAINELRKRVERQKPTAPPAPPRGPAARGHTRGPPQQRDTSVGRSSFSQERSTTQSGTADPVCHPRLVSRGGDPRQRSDDRSP